MLFSSYFSCVIKYLFCCLLQI